MDYRLAYSHLASTHFKYIIFIFFKYNFDEHIEMAAILEIVAYFYCEQSLILKPVAFRRR